MTQTTTALNLSSPPEEESSSTSSSSSSDFISSGDSYTGNIDWDGEWKKVVEQRGQKNAVKRPGQYKSEVEIAATKVTRAAQDNVLKTVKVIKQQSSPSYGIDWKNDPKVWIGILALISVAWAVLTAPQQGYYPDFPTSDASASSGGSFYI